MQFGVFGDVVVRVGFGEHHVVFAASGQGGSGFGVDLQYLQGERRGVFSKVAEGFR